MNIVVCIKQVPDVPNIRMDRERMTIIREGVESVINPLDYVALQAALDMRKRKGGSVTVLTMGPPQSESGPERGPGIRRRQGRSIIGSPFCGARTPWRPPTSWRVRCRT